MGSCVGIKGARIHGIVRELRNENIDVLNYTPRLDIMVQRALAPAKVSSLKVDEEAKKVEVFMEPDQVSLAIGKGGCNIKQHYGARALSIFIQPPSVEELRRRLVKRATDAPEVIEQRLQKASYELTFAPRFDHVVVNDDLQKAEEETYRLVSEFLKR